MRPSSPHRLALLCEAHPGRQPPPSPPRPPAVKAESHPQHTVRSQTTQQFTEGLCEEMVANTVDGVVYDPSRGLKRQRPINGAVLEGPVETEGVNHVLASYGKKSDRDESVKGTKQDYAIQRPCTECGKKTNFYCTRAECKGHGIAQNTAPPVCNTSVRGCFLAYVRRAPGVGAAVAAPARPHGNGRRGSAPL